MTRGLLVTRVDTVQSVHFGQECQCCSKKAVLGESLLVHRNSLLDAPAYEHYLRLHVRCVRSLVDSADPDVDEKAFERERLRIIETGELWPKSSN